MNLNTRANYVAQTLRLGGGRSGCRLCGPELIAWCVRLLEELTAGGNVSATATGRSPRPADAGGGNGAEIVAGMDAGRVSEVVTDAGMDVNMKDPRRQEALVGGLAAARWIAEILGGEGGTRKGYHAADLAPPGNCLIPPRVREGLLNIGLAPLSMVIGLLSLSCSSRREAADWLSFNLPFFVPHTAASRATSLMGKDGDRPMTYVSGGGRPRGGH